MYKRVCPVLHLPCFVLGLEKIPQMPLELVHRALKGAQLDRVQR